MTKSAKGWQSLPRPTSLILGLALGWGLCPATLLAGGGAAKPESKGPEEAKQLMRATVDRSAYIHNWVAMPSFTARAVPHLDKVTIAPIAGRIEVLVFLASWNVTTLRIAGELAELEKRYRHRGVDFIYAFSHDQLADIRGFLKEFPLKGQAVLANRSMLDVHMQPKIPTILIADKHGWLTYRKSRFTAATLKEIDRLLSILSGL